MAWCCKTVLLFCCLASVWLSVESMNMTQSLRSLLDYFTETRNVDINFDAKQEARDFIVKTFKDHGLHTWTEEFPSNNAQYPGMNIIGQLSGRYTGSRDDKIVLIGSHYDTVDTTHGVDDNGSGITALLQALKLYTNPDKVNCARDYTLLFVAFDLEESQPRCPMQGNCPCGGGLCGSHHFVQNLTRYLNSTEAGFQGAFILETILNHNTTPNSQVLPQGMQLFFGPLYKEVSDNQFRGDFLAVIGRVLDDDKLMDAITNAFKNDATFKSLAVKIPAPAGGRPSKWSVVVQNVMSNFFRSDHYPFWNAEPSLPAVFVTDTANFRGYMQQCYHRSCDDINHVTPDMMTFLARTTESIAKVASNMTNETCEMKKADCVQNFTAEEGEITTPYFNTQYPNKLDCAWTISVDAGQKDLSLKFTTFDLEKSESCTADYVEIWKGEDETAPLIGKYCGSRLPETIKTRAQSLYITFHSDELGTFKGFKAKWGLTPVVSDAKGYHQVMWQLIGGIVMTSLAFGL